MTNNPPNHTPSSHQSGLIWALAVAFGLLLLGVGIARLRTPGGGWQALPLLVEGAVVLGFCLHSWLSTVVRMLVLVVLVTHCNQRSFRLRARVLRKLLVACLPVRALWRTGHQQY